MDRIFHIAAVVQVNEGRYDTYMIFIIEIMDCAVHIGAVFQNWDRRIEHALFCFSRVSKNVKWPYLQFAVMQNANSDKNISNIDNML